MQRDDSTPRYRSVAILLHWVMALGIATLAVMGLALLGDDVTLQTACALVQQQ